MKLTINNKIYQLESDIIILSDLLKKYSLNPKNVIVECNNKIVKQEKFEIYNLNENDIINIFSFVGGG